MRIERAAEQGVTVITLAGELDAPSLATVRDEIDGLIGGGVERLVVNLRGVTLINSSALGYLIMIHKQLHEVGGGLALSEPSKVLQSTLQALGIDRVFVVLGSDGEAVEHLRAGEGDAAREPLQ